MGVLTFRGVLVLLGKRSSHTRLAVSCLVSVDNTLRHCLVESASCVLEGFSCLGGITSSKSLAEATDLGLKRAADRLVALVRSVVLKDSLLLGLNVGHGCLFCAITGS